MTEQPYPLQTDPPETAQKGMPVFKNALSALRGWLQHPLNFFVLLLSLIPVCLVAILIQQKAANIPAWDQWETDVKIAIDYKEGDFEIGDLLMQRNEHSYLVSNTWSFMFILFTDWNLKWQVFSFILIAIGSWLVAVRLFYAHDKSGILLVMIPFAMLLFSLRQQLNWMLGTQSVWHFILFLTLSAITILKTVRYQWLAVGLAAVCAVLGTASSAQGIPLWFLLPVVMWMLGYRNFNQYVFWAVSTVLVLAAYFIWFDASVMGADEGGQSAGLVFDPPLLIRYMITYLGGPFVPLDPDYASLAFGIGVMGIALFTLNAFFLWRESRQLSSVGAWLGVGFYSMGLGVMIGLGRAHIFPENPTPPLLERYTTYAGLHWLATIALMALLIRQLMQKVQRRFWQNTLLYGNLIAGVVLVGLYLGANYDLAKSPPLIDDVEENCVADFPLLRNSRCFNLIFIRGTALGDVNHRIDQLAANDLSIFAERSPDFDAIIALSRLEGRRVGEQTRTEYQTQNLSANFRGLFLFQHPPSTVEYDITLPQTEADHKLEFRSGIWVDTQNLDDTNIPAPQDGALFRVLVRRADGQIVTIFENTADPNINQNMRYMSADLKPYAGEQVTLILQTEILSNPYYDWAMWLDPVIALYKD